MKGLERLSGLSEGALPALAAGLLLFPLLSFLDRAAAGLLPSALVEETCKFLLVLAFAGLPPSRSSGTSRAIVAITIFSALETLAYQASFPGTPVWGRLFWSSPVHLVAALAAALALGRAGLGLRRALGGALALGFGLAWHLLANALAGLPGGPGPLLLAALSIANLALIVALSRAYFLEVILGEGAGTEVTDHA